MTDSSITLPHGGKQPVSNKLVIAVVSLAILTFLGILSETSLNIAYSTLMEEFSIGASVVQWLTTGYLLLLSVSIPSSPFMVRKFATKTLFIMEKAPLEQRGAMLGIVSLVTCAAPAIGPVFGGVVMEYLNWHWIFYIMLPFLLLAFLLGIGTVPEIRHGEKATISVPSLLMVAVGLASVILAVSFFAEWNGDWRFWVVLMFGVAMSAAFAWVQLKMEHPLIEVRVFAYPGFSLGMLILLMASGSVLGLNFLLPILLQRGFGMGSLVAALALLPGAVVGAVSAPVISSLLESHFPPKFIIIGFAGTVIMDVVFVALSGNVWVVAIAYAFFMAFSGFVLVPDQTHALNQLPARLNADGSAAMNTIQSASPTAPSSEGA